jgi:hypothetical protein
MLTFKSFITEAKKASSLAPIKGPSFKEIQTQDRTSEAAFRKTAKKQNPTPEQKGAILQYTVGPSSMTKDEHKHLHDFLHSQPTEHEGVVYRGFHPLHHEFAKADKEAGREVPYVDIHHPRPMSTTTDARSATTFAKDDPEYHQHLPKTLQKRLADPSSRDVVGHTMRLTVPQGHYAASIRDHSGFESKEHQIVSHRNESEVLFPKGQTVRIYRHPSITRKLTGFGRYQQTHHLVTWRGEVLPKDHKD